MREVAVIGVGMHPFGRFPDRSMKELGRLATMAAAKDAGVELKDIGVAYVGNSLAGLLVGQEGVRGQTILQHTGIGDIPVVNVENACASASTAFRGAWLEVASGAHDVALALGVEKMFVGDTGRSLAALAADSEVELATMGMQFSANYAIHPKYNLRQKMDDFGWTAEDYALCSVKNSRNGSMNPLAQHRRALTVDEVLASPMISYPLTLYMCSSIGDGAAAAILCTKDMASHFTSRPAVIVASCVLRSGHIFGSLDHDFSMAHRVIEEAYEKAGIEAADVGVAEVHDAMAPVELLIYESLGLCGRGEGANLIRNGTTAIDGAHPVNTSGGLTARGHPVGATGLAQIAEIVWQMRGEAGERQVPKRPTVGLAHNQGGLLLGMDSAAYMVTVLKR
jgi:acetyl-CoA acetyltransferase